MKKCIFMLIIIMLLTGCSKSNEHVVNQNDDNVQITLKKIDNDKDRVYFTIYRNLLLDDEEYELLIPTINLNSKDVSNVNLEMKTFVGNTYTNLSLDKNVIIAGNIISYDVYEYENIITVKQNYAFYFEGSYLSHYSNIYCIDYESGELLSNELLLKMYDLDEEKLFDYMSDNIDSKEVDYVIMNVKNEGYKLYVNDDGKLVINYIDRDNDEENEKELIYN